MKADNQRSETIFDVDFHNFDRLVFQASHHKPVLVDLWAEWCSPCLVIAPILHQLVEEYEGEMLLGKVEVDKDDGENMKLAGHFRVRGFPTVIMFVDGEEQARFSGAKPLPYLRQFVDEHAAQ